MAIKIFNEQVQKDYIEHEIFHASQESYPLMKYDEDYGGKKPFEKVRFFSVGLNPSLTGDAITILNDLRKSHGSFDNVKELTEYQNELKYSKQEKSKQIPYFKRIDGFFKEISGSNTFKDSVFHYDFCQLRKTNSNKIKPVIKNNFKLLFGHFSQIIQIVNPEVIFIFNGFLSSLLLEKKFTTPKPDKKNGCYFLKGMNHSPKIVLANQLSGGATSKVHKELLIWHSKRLINE